MEKLSTMEQVKKAFNISDLLNLKESEAVIIESNLDKIDPDLAKEIITANKEIFSSVVDKYDSYTGLLSESLQHNAENMKAVNGIHSANAESFRKEMEKAEDPEVKKYFAEKAAEEGDKIDRADANDKEHRANTQNEAGMVLFGLGFLALGLTGLILTGRAHFGKK